MIRPTQPPSAPTSDSSPASSRERIVAHSLTLFSSRGYNGVSMNEIAQATGITKAALYYHFEDKEALFLEVIRTKTARMAQDLERIITSDVDLETMLRDTALFLLNDGLGEYRQLQSDLLTVVAEDRRHKTLQATRDLLNRVLPRIREEQAAGNLDASLDIEAAVPLFFSMIGGQIRRFALGPKDRMTTTTNEELADLIVRIWLHGTEAKHTGTSQQT